MMGVAVSKEGVQKQVTDIGRAKIAVEKMKKKAAASSPPSAKANDEAENQNTSQELLVKPAKQEVEVDPSSAAWVKISVWQKFTRKFQRSEHKKRTVATKVTEAEDEEATRRFRNKALFRPAGPDFGQINPLSPLRYDYFLPPPTEEEEECSFCHMLLYDTLHRCRVCAKYYHSKCLYTHTGVGQDSASKAALALSDGDIGWSCPSCENLGDLLTEDEMMLIMDKFESLDVDQDTTISEDEYVSYHKKKHREMFGEDLPPKEEATCCERFNIMDKNNDGSISWSEFINTEALEYLFRRRSQNQLVQMLTPLEIDRIRMIFCRFDEGSRGVITIDESQEVLEEWRGRLGFGKSSAAVSDFVKTHKINLECERLVSWEVFIRENALTFISARPNTVDMKPFVVTEESLHRLHLKQCDDIRNDEANGNRGRKVSTFRW